MVTVLVGMTVKGIGLTAFSRALAGADLPPERLRSYAASLEGLDDYSESLPAVFRAEYQVAMNSIKDMVEGKMDWRAVAPAGESPRNVWSRQVRLGLVYKPNETRRLFVEQYRRWIEDVPKPLAQVRPLELVRPRDMGTVRLITRGNLVGHMLCAIFVPVGEGVLKLKCQARTHVAAVRAMLALKCYKAATGRLPDTLDELVPDYLDAVPLDDFDGRPLRYSPAKRVLYSVGEDLKDSGGFTREEAAARVRKEHPGLSAEEVEKDYDVSPEGAPDPSWPIDF